MTSWRHVRLFGTLQHRVREAVCGRTRRLSARYFRGGGKYRAKSDRQHRVAFWSGRSTTRSISAQNLRGHVVYASITRAHFSETPRCVALFKGNGASLRGADGCRRRCSADRPPKPNRCNPLCTRARAYCRIDNQRPVRALAVERPSPARTPGNPFESVARRIVDLIQVSPWS